MFNNFSFSDEEFLKLISDYNPLIKRYSYIYGRFDEDLEQEIILKLYKTLTSNFKK